MTRQQCSENGQNQNSTIKKVQNFKQKDKTHPSYNQALALHIEDFPRRWVLFPLPFRSSRIVWASTLRIRSILTMILHNMVFGKKILPFLYLYLAYISIILKEIRSV